MFAVLDVRGFGACVFAGLQVFGVDVNGWWGGGARRTDKKEDVEELQNPISHKNPERTNPETPCHTGGHSWPQVDDERLSAKFGLGVGSRPCSRELGFRV